MIVDEEMNGLPCQLFAAFKGRGGIYIAAKKKINKKAD